MTQPEHPVPVASTIIEDDDSVLFVCESKSGVAGTWNLPGGHVEANELPPVTACREATEEAGVSVTIEALVGIYYAHDDAVDGVVANHVFVGSTADDPVPGSEDTVTAVQWAPPDTGLQLRGPSVRRALNDYRAGAQFDVSVFHGLTRTN